MRTKSPHRIRRQQLLLALGIILVPGWAVIAQDKITTRDGRTQDVKILGATPTSLQVQVGSGSIGIPMSTVATVTMAPPADFVAGIAAFDACDYAKALASMRAVVEKFKGLKTEWAEQAAALLGDIYVATDKLPEAEAAYQEFQKLYGGQGSVRSNVGLARIAISKKDYAGAQQKLEPIAAQALEQKNPAPSVAPAYSQAFFLLGEVCEARQDYPAALENYLLTVTLFHADRTAVAAAQQKADALRKNHEVTAP